MLDDNTDWRREHLERRDVARAQRDAILAYYAKAAGYEPGTELPPEAYPEAYAGSYINTDGDLVVMVTEGCEAYLKTLREITGNAVLLWEIADYPYRELRAAWDMVHEALPSIMMDFKISALILNEYENRLELYMSDVTPAVERDFRRKVTDSGAVVLRENE